MDSSLISDCLIGDYHWYSREILKLYLNKVINTGEFSRWFHMPNSDYLPTSECIIAALDPNYNPQEWKPGILDGYGSARN